MEKPLPPPLSKENEVKPRAEPPIDEGSFESISRLERTYSRTSIDPRTRTRTRPMEVLVIGMMRTGTFSLKAALRRLGYKVYHMDSVFENPPDAYMWAEAMKYKYKGKGQKFTRKEWDNLLGQYSASVDVPPALFMPELIEAYPEAKVIVSERDVDKWYKSVQNTILKVTPAWWNIPLYFLDFAFYVPFGSMASQFNDAFGGNLKDPAKAKRAYRAHYEEVRGLVPKGPRRLDFQLGDGWEPLCKFLGKEVPAGVPFPHLNDTNDLVKAQEVARAYAWRRVGGTLFKFFVRVAIMALIALGPLMFLPKEMFANLRG